MMQISRLLSCLIAIAALGPLACRGTAPSPRPPQPRAAEAVSLFGDPLVRRSPITHVAKITTPLMLIEGEADYRTPPGAGGEMMFRALKYLKRPVVMVRFPDESHDLSRSGRPWHRVERLRHIVAWFDKYLQGKKIDIYELP